jgi:regulator of protease activity HflC (stomatin/prohibitin superfamily)
MSASTRTSQSTSKSSHRRALRHTFSKVLYIVTLHRKYARALTFENVWQDALELDRPTTSGSERPSTAKTRPSSGLPVSEVFFMRDESISRPLLTLVYLTTSASRRPATAKKFTSSDLLKSASGLFSVFDRNKAQDEVRKLEEDVKGVEKVQAKLAKAEQKAALATEKAEKAHKELMARAEV